MTWLVDRLISLYCAMNIAATASYKAVPLILITAPTGATNLDTGRLTPMSDSRTRKVTGNVAELQRKG